MVEAGGRRSQLGEGLFAGGVAAINAEGAVEHVLGATVVALGHANVAEVEVEDNR